MNRNWLIGTAIMLSAATTLVLPQLAGNALTARGNYGVLQTIGPGAVILEDDNLVDALSGIPFSLMIDKAGWENGVLSLDLKVNGDAHEPQELYQNMALAIAFAIQETGNVDQLLLRVVAEDQWLNTRRLLLAGDIRRSEWTPQLQETLRNAGNTPLPDPLKNGFRISESELWKKQFIYP
ncbi:hypothetical protein HQN87_05725 [Paenibacillus tritici]|uniref:Copper amine oxidase-like N-terminal domain-containing protein n=1 Tax=Paenibacillus tritici TaxID=1873425 RepID=A0ABX2DMH2_9BACL|nr:hypothetical protein [Paenibacillus tritici]NQX44819.1 hypothetical protein [Paenibacillus tritici]QUL52886.1 hypothetical protein KDC22_20935 [Paenibacillus tritici]